MLYEYPTKTKSHLVVITTDGLEFAFPRNHFTHNLLVSFNVPSQNILLTELANHRFTFTACTNMILNQSFPYFTLREIICINR